jgi:hypothetical protein
MSVLLLPYIYGLNTEKIKTNDIIRDYYFFDTVGIYLEGKNVDYFKPNNFTILINYQIIPKNGDPTNEFILFKYSNNDHNFKINVNYDHYYCTHVFYIDDIYLNSLPCTTSFNTGATLFQYSNNKFSISYSSDDFTDLYYLDFTINSNTASILNNMSTGIGNLELANLNQSSIGLTISTLKLFNNSFSPLENAVYLLYNFKYDLSYFRLCIANNYGGYICTEYNDLFYDSNLYDIYSTTNFQITPDKYIDILNNNGVNTINIISNISSDVYYITSTINNTFQITTQNYKYNIYNINLNFQLNNYFVGRIGTQILIHINDINTCDIYGTPSSYLNIRFNIYTYTFTCYITNSVPGIYPILVSFDNGNSFINTNQNFTILEYQYTPIISNSKSPAILANSIVIYNNVSISLGTGIGIISFILIIVLIFRYTYYHQMNKILTKIDLLYLTTKNKNYTENGSVSNIIELGPQSEIKYKTSIFGGLMTILTIGIILIVSYIYLQNDISNSELITIIGGLPSNGNIIKLDNSYINVSMTFKNLIHTNCDIGGNICDNNWSNNNPVGNLFCNQIIVDSFRKDCTVNWVCTNCQSDVITNDGLTIISNTYNGIYEYLEYVVTVNSYNDGKSIVTGIIENKNNQMYGSYSASPNSQLLTISSNPTVYQYYSKPTSTGFILDFQGQVIGETLPVIPENVPLSTQIYSYPLNQYFQMYPNEYLQSTYISANFKINKNPTWLYITLNSRVSVLDELSKLAGLALFIYTIMKFINNILCKEYMRKMYYLILCKKRKEDFKDIFDNVTIQSEFVKNYKENEKVENINNLVMNPVNLNEENNLEKPKIIHSHKNSSVELVRFSDGISMFRDTTLIGSTGSFSVN